MPAALPLLLELLVELAELMVELAEKAPQVQVLLLLGFQLGAQGCQLGLAFLVPVDEGGFVLADQGGHLLLVILELLGLALNCLA